MKNLKLKLLTRRYVGGGGANPPADEPTITNSSGDTSPQGNPADSTPNEPAPRTFTQEEVNRLMAREKNEGRRSVLKELGVEKIDDAKSSLQAYKEYQDAQKTSEQKANEEKQNLQNQLKAAQSEKNLAESKLALFTSGCNKDFIDEALVLVNAKISDEVTFEQAIEDVKKKFPAMFESSEISGAKGTGTGVNRKNASNSNSDSLATTLAKQRVKTTQTNPYFKKG